MAAPATLRYPGVMPECMPPRLAWAFERLAVKPTEHLLEIGCGHGLLADQIAGRLTAGTLTAIDRSETVIAIAEKRAASQVEAGRASLHALALADTGFGEGCFDRVFAVNVNLFWIDPRRELEVVRRLLKPGANLELSTSHQATRSPKRCFHCWTKSWWPAASSWPHGLRHRSARRSASMSPHGLSDDGKRPRNGKKRLNRFGPGAPSFSA